MKKIKLITGSVLTVLMLTLTVFTAPAKANTSSLTLTGNGESITILAGHKIMIENDAGIYIRQLLASGEEIGDITFPDGQYENELTVSGNGKLALIGNGESITILAGHKIMIEKDAGIYIRQLSASGEEIGDITFPDGQYENELIVVATQDNQRPAISGEENFATNVDDAKPVTYFQSFLTAVDETDGVVPVYVVTDNYTANKSVLGTHKVIFGAKDSAGNEATLEAYIRVVDITVPIITGNSSVVKIGYKETWNIQTFKSTLTVSDNYSTLTNADITVKSDNYTANKTKLGTYNVVFAAKDSSNNEGTFTKPVQVYDNVRPTFSGPTKLSTSNTTILTESDVKSQLTANDEIDGNLTSKIKLVEDNFTGKGNKVGTYTIKYNVTDNAGNITEHIVTIERLDSIPPIIWIEDGVSIKTTPTTPLTFEQIISILQATGQVSSNTQTRFSLKYDEYTGNESTPGVYAMSINARSVDGNESLHNMSITVLDDSNDDGITTTPDFNIKNWIKENPALVAIGVVSVIGIGYFVFRKKK